MIISTDAEKAFNKIKHPFMMYKKQTNKRTSRKLVFKEPTTT